MSDSFKALVLNQERENFTRDIKSIDKSNILIIVQWIRYSIFGQSQKVIYQH